MNEIFSLQTLVSELSSKKSQSKDQYESILKRVHLKREDYSPFLLFEEDYYTRNLIFQDQNFELMLICWQGKKETSIHNHQGSYGWILCLEGALEEIQYQPLESEGSKASFKKIHSKRLLAKNLSYIDDSIAWHSISHSRKEKSITLHLYAPPIKNCHIYSEKTLREKEMSFDQNFMSQFSDLTWRKNSSFENSANL